jgi:hypothetical protein
MKLINIIFNEKNKIIDLIYVSKDKELVLVDKIKNKYLKSLSESIWKGLSNIINA